MNVVTTDGDKVIFYIETYTMTEALLATIKELYALPEDEKPKLIKAEVNFTKEGMPYLIPFEPDFGGVLCLLRIPDDLLALATKKENEVPEGQIVDNTEKGPNANRLDAMEPYQMKSYTERIRREGLKVKSGQVDLDGKTPAPPKNQRPMVESENSSRKAR